MPFTRDPVTGLPGYKLPEFDEEQAAEAGDERGEQVDLTAPMDPPPAPAASPEAQDSDFGAPIDATAHAEGDFLRMPPPMSTIDAAKQQAVNRANVGMLGDINRSSDEHRQRDRADFRREMALRMAQEADPHSTVDQVVLRAQAYLMFLEGEDRYRQADTAEQ